MGQISTRSSPYSRPPSAAVTAMHRLADHGRRVLCSEAGWRRWLEAEATCPTATPMNVAIATSVLPTATRVVAPQAPSPGSPAPSITLVGSPRAGALSTRRATLPVPVLADAALVVLRARGWHLFSVTGTTTERTPLHEGFESSAPGAYHVDHDARTVTFSTLHPAPAMDAEHFTVIARALGDVAMRDDPVVRSIAPMCNLVVESYAHLLLCALGMPSRPRLAEVDGWLHNGAGSAHALRHRMDKLRTRLRADLDGLAAALHHPHGTDTHSRAPIATGSVSAQPARPLVAVGG